MLGGNAGQIVIDYANEQLSLMRLVSELNGKISPEDLAALSQAFEAKKTGDTAKVAQLTQAQQTWFSKYETYRNSQEALLAKMHQLDGAAQVGPEASLLRLTSAISQVAPKKDVSEAAQTSHFTPSASSARQTAQTSKRDDDPENFGKGWLKPGFL